MLSNTVRGALARIVLTLGLASVAGAALFASLDFATRSVVI